MLTMYVIEFEKEKNWKINYFEINPNDISSNFEKVFDIIIIAYNFIII